MDFTIATNAGPHSRSGHGVSFLGQSERCFSRLRTSFAFNLAFDPGAVYPERSGAGERRCGGIAALEAEAVAGQD